MLKCTSLNKYEPIHSNVRFFKKKKKKTFRDLESHNNVVKIFSLVSWGCVQKTLDINHLYISANRSCETEIQG